MIRRIFGNPFLGKRLISSAEAFSLSKKYRDHRKLELSPFLLKIKKETEKSIKRNCIKGYYNCYHQNQNLDKLTLDELRKVIYYFKRNNFICKKYSHNGSTVIFLDWSLQYSQEDKSYNDWANLAATI